MKKLLIGLAVIIAATPASADQLGSLYAGVQGGYHSVGDNGLGDDVAGILYGGYIGVNTRLRGNWIVGGEGNFNAASSDLDSDFGFSAHAGYAFSEGSMVFVRAGYQWVNFDLVNISEEALGRPLTDAEIAILDDADDTEGGFLVGAGVQIGLGEKFSTRAVVDTIEFDSIRITGGVAYHF